MKKLLLVLVVACACLSGYAQTATSSIVLGIGGTDCNKSNNKFYGLLYNPVTNVLSATGGIAHCTPTFQHNVAFSIYSATVAYNPKDQYVYYSEYLSNVGKSYIYKWPVSACPTGTIDTVMSFPTFVNLCFDNSGTGWMVNYHGNNAPYTLYLQQVDFTTKQLGVEKKITLPSTMSITAQNGDLVVAPNGIMYVVFDNQLFTVDYKDYATATTTTGLSATFISKVTGTASLNVGSSLVGLAYAGGEFVGAYSGNNKCGYSEINTATAAATGVSMETGYSYSSTDNTSVVSGIGLSKELVSLDSIAGSGGQYKVVFDVYVKNYGNYPLSSVQVTDDLTKISNSLTIVSASAALTSNPAGVTLNSSYNGTTNVNLLASNSTLTNYPEANNNFTVRITAVISGMVSGKIYYNSAIGTAVGLNNVSLKDSSTNGNEPDLNLNGKPDDTGEGTPTPFVISVAAQAEPCTMLSTYLHYQTFGTSSSTSLPAPTIGNTGTTEYTLTSVTPAPTERYVIAKNPNTWNTAYWNTLKDHTTGTGNMMVVNADTKTSVVYSATVAGSCASTKYSFTAQVANISNDAQKTYCNATAGNFHYPKLLLQVLDSVTKNVLCYYVTDEITSTTWQTIGFRFTLPVGYDKMLIQIVNQGAGGCGNDFALDDITFGLCDPLPSVAVDSKSGCPGQPIDMRVILSDSSVISGALNYQWQSSTTGTGSWTTITTATTSVYNAPAGDTKYYQVIVGATGSTASCLFTSAPPFRAVAKTESTLPASASVTSSNDLTCALTESTLTLNNTSSSNLGTNAAWTWSAGSCDSTAIASGVTSLTVSPKFTTTYYVKAAGDCNNTSCVSVTVTSGCVLATELLYFHGTATGNQVNLSWKVTENDKITSFDVERSLEGGSYQVIGNVPATGAAGDVVYTSTDNVAALHAKNITYRLRIFFKTSATKQSQVVVINRGAVTDNDITVYPNPASQQLNIAVHVDAPQKMTYMVTNMLGQVILVGSQELVKGDNIVVVQDLDRLVKGTYVVGVILSGTTVQKKVVIQR